MVRTALRTHQPHVVIPSVTDDAILWIGRNVLRLRPREDSAAAVLQLQLLDLMFCIPFVWAIMVSWLGPNKHAEPPETLWAAVLLVFAVARFVIHVVVRMRSVPADDAFCEEADVEFFTKACDAATLAEAVFLLSSFLRMTPATALAFLFAMLNYHQIRLWRSQFRKTQGPALWVGGLTWEVLMLSFVILLTVTVPLDWQAMEELREASYGWHDHVKRMFDQYEWLTQMSVSLVGVVSGFILLFQTATTLIDLGRMLRIVENEPGLRRKGVHQTVGRLLFAAVVPNMAFNAIVGFWILPRFEWPCVPPRPAVVFLMIFFGHTATVLQITYDRITCGRYGMVYASDIVVGVLCATWWMTCVPMERVAACVCFFTAFWVWLSGVAVLAVREAPL